MIDKELAQTWICPHIEMPLDKEQVLVIYPNGKLSFNWTYNGVWQRFTGRLPSWWIPLPEAPKK